MKLCRAEAASRSASSSTPTHLAARRHDRHVPQAALQHVHQDRLGGQVRGDAAGGCAHHLGDGHVDGDARGDHPGAQVAVGEDAEFAVGQPDQRVGDVVFGHPAHRIAHRASAVRPTARRRAPTRRPALLSVVGRDRRPIGAAHVPRRRCQEGQAGRLARTVPAPAHPAAGSGCSASWPSPRIPFRHR